MLEADIPNLVLVDSEMEFGFSVKNSENRRFRNLYSETETEFIVKLVFLCGIFSVKPNLAGFSVEMGKYLYWGSEQCNGRMDNRFWLTLLQIF